MKQSPFLLGVYLQLLITMNEYNQCVSSSPSQTLLLLLPLKAEVISASILPGAKPAGPNKLSFRHNVFLTLTVTVGSPPQQATMVLDTGSELSWLHCKKTPTTPLSFEPLLSSTYRTVPCSSATCTTQTRDFSVPATCDAKQMCHTVLSYADASSVEGNLASDSFHFDATNTLPGMMFGCMDTSTSTNPEDARTTGLMGMNRGSLSFVNQMKSPKFSYCISGSDSSGVLLLGDASFPWLKPLNYTPLVQISTPLPYFDRVAYTVQLEGIRVSNTLLPLPKSVFEPDHTGAGQTMVDSGTQFTFLLGPVYTALKNEFLRQTRGVLRPLDDPNFVFQGVMDLCFKVGLKEALPTTLPSVNLLFRGAEMSVYGENKLLYKVPGGGVVRGGDDVYCFTFGNSDLLGVEAYVIGNHHQQNMWVEYDLVRSRFGIAEFSCELAGQKLGLHH